MPWILRRHRLHCLKLCFEAFVSHFRHRHCNCYSLFHLVRPFDHRLLVFDLVQRGHLSPGILDRRPSFQIHKRPEDNAFHPLEDNSYLLPVLASCWDSLAWEFRTWQDGHMDSHQEDPFEVVEDIVHREEVASCPDSSFAEDHHHRAFAA